MTLTNAFDSVVAPYLIPLGFRRRGKIFGRYLEKDKMFIYLAYEMFSGTSNYRIWTSIVSIYNSCPIYKNRILTIADPKCDAIQICAEEEYGFRFLQVNGLKVWEKYTPEQFMHSLHDTFKYQYKIVCDLNQIDSLNALYKFSQRIFDKARFRVNMQLSLFPLAFILNKKEEAYRLADEIYQLDNQYYKEERNNPDTKYVSMLVARVEQWKKMRADIEKWNIDKYLEDIYSTAKENEEIYKKFLR